MVRLLAMKCPKCNADITINPDQKTAFCQYCGAQILFENENDFTVQANAKIDLNVTYREVDEAAIKQAEADIRRSDAEIIHTITSADERKRVFEDKNSKYRSAVIRSRIGYFTMLGIGIFLFVTSVFCFIAAFSHMFFEDETYKKFVKEIRYLLKNKEVFKNNYCKVNHIISREHKVREEMGKRLYIKTLNNESRRY